MPAVARVAPRALLAPLLLAAVVIAALAGPTAEPQRSAAGVEQLPDPPVQVSAAAASRHPNIVVVMADDMRTDDLRFMPAVRSLIAERGLTFRNSFSPYPLCCPARTSFLTGQYAHNHHVLSNGAPYGGFGAFDDSRTIGSALYSSGYQTAFIGKYLNGYGRDTSVATGGSSFRYVPPGWTDWYGAVSRPPGSPYTSGDTYDYMHTIFNINGRIDDTHKGEYQTNVIGQFARSLVEKYAGTPRPFFLWASFVAPHFGAPLERGDPAPIVRPHSNRTYRIRTPARPLWVRGRFDSRIPRASGLPVDGGPSEADVSDKPRPMRYRSELRPIERYAVRDLTRQRAEALYVLDRQVAKLVQTLRDTGQLDDTVLMFTSDNGYFLGEHRVRQGKIKPHEPSLRVPFLVAGPGVPHGERFDPVTTPGVTATIADLAGATGRMPHALDARSLVPSFRADRGWRAPVVTEGIEPGNVFPANPILRAPGFDDPRNTIGIRTARWKYVRYANGDGELYDLDHDPNELHSHFDEPGYRAVQQRLRRLWGRYKDCAGASCLAALPASLQRGPAADRRDTDIQSRGVERRYGYWR